ncbi:MAG: response regulator transcription factor [Bacteroidales bacterium]
MKSKLTLLIVDDHKIFRDGLKLLLSHFPFIGEVHEVSNGLEFLQMLDSIEPDLVMMDINMPVMGGIEATKKALERYPDLKIIVLTTFHDEHFVEQMMIAGVEGYMLKRSTPEEFETAILRVSSGGNYFSDEILRTVVKKLNQMREESDLKSGLPVLTEREQEILELLCKGLNNERISEIIHLSPKTIEKHKSNLFQKTDTSNTVNLIIYAFRNDLVKSLHQ